MPGLPRCLTLASCAVIALGLPLARADAQRYTAPPADAEPAHLQSSCAAEASTEIDRGTAFLLLEARREARAAFSRAAELDADCALAYWGQASSRLPLVPGSITLDDLEAERRTIKRGRAVGGKTALERGLMDAAIALFAPPIGTPIGTRLENHEARLRELVAEHGASIVLPVLHARSALLRSTLPNDAARGRARTILEAAVRGGEWTPGAAVSWLEAADAATTPALTRRAAAHVAGARVPVPHRLALRAHVALGDWPLAVKAGEAAHAFADMPAEESSRDDAPSRLTSAEWLTEAHLQRGQYAAARSVASRVARTQQPGADTGLERAAARVAARITLDARDVSGAVPQVEATETARQGWPLRFAEGARAAWSAWPGGSRDRLAAAEAARQALAAAASDAADPECALAGALLEAMMAASQDEHHHVAMLLAHAGGLETELRDTGRLRLPLVPVSELAAEIWLRLYRYPDAEREARATLARYPNRIRASLTLARALTAQRRLADARTAYERVAELRRNADAGDAVLAEARRALSPSPPDPDRPEAERPHGRQPNAG